VQIRFLKSYRAYRAGDVVDVTDGLAKMLAMRGTAIMEHGPQQPLGFGRAETATAVREIRTATIRR